MKYKSTTIVLVIFVALALTVASTLLTAASAFAAPDAQVFAAATAQHSVVSVGLMRITGVLSPSVDEDFGDRPRAARGTLPNF